MSQSEYSVTPIDLTTAGFQEITLESDVFLFMTAIRAGVVDLDAKIEVALGEAVDDYLPMWVNNKVYGQTRRYKVRWDAQPGVVAYIFLSRDRALVDALAPPSKQLVTNALSDAMTAAAVAVGSGAAVLLAAANTTRAAMTIQNIGTADVYLGPAGVTSATGLKLAAGQSYTTTTSTAAFYGRAASGTQDVRVLEES